MGSSSELPTLALLAGGLAKRLRPTTYDIPKAMVPIQGEPFIAHQLRLFANGGLSHVIICLGHLGEQIQAYVGDGSAFGLLVSYSYDGDSLLGTGGAINKALDELGDIFFVMYGDSYFEIDFRFVLKAFERSGKLSLMTVMRNAGQWDASNVRYANGEVLEYAKNTDRTDMDYIDYGLSVFKAEAFDKVHEEQSLDLGTLQGRLAHNGDLAGLEVNRRFYEIGTPEGLSDFKAYMISRSCDGRQNV